MWLISTCICYMSWSSSPIPAAAVMNPDANVGRWQWVVVAAATVMEGGSSKGNSNGGETRACVAVDC
jgi:hypothetical protein